MSKSTRNAAFDLAMREMEADYATPRSGLRLEPGKHAEPWTSHMLATDWFTANWPTIGQHNAFPIRALVEEL